MRVWGTYISGVLELVGGYMEGMRAMFCVETMTAATLMKVQQQAAHIVAANKP